MGKDVCAGSGIVPNMSILKHALGTGMKLRHTLIYGNKSAPDIIFRRELEALREEYPDRLGIVHALSREESAADPSGVEVFACGPGIGKWERLAAKEAGTEPRPRFMETVLEALDHVGIPRERIHRESYG